MEEDGKSSEHQIRIGEYALAARFPAQLLRSILGFGIDFRKGGFLYDKRENHKCGTQNGIRHDYPSDKVVENKTLLHITKSSGLDEGKEFAVARVENNCGKNQRRDDSSDFVAYSHNAHPPGGTLDRPDDGDIRIGCSLEYGKAGSYHKEAEKKQPEFPYKCGRNEDKHTCGHYQEAYHYAVLESRLFEQYAGRYRHHEIRNVEGKGYEIGLEMSQFAGDSEIRNQNGIHPGHKAEDEKHYGENNHRPYIGFIPVHRVFCKVCFVISEDLLSVQNKL